MREIRQLVPGEEQLVEDFLTTWPESSLLMLSNLRQVGLKQGKGAYHGCYMGSFGQKGRLRGVAAHYWNGMLFLRAEEDAGVLARDLVGASGFGLSGLSGPADQIEAAKRSLGVSARPTSFESELDVMALDLAHMKVPGVLNEPIIKARRARSSELDIIANWLTRFKLEVEGAIESPALFGNTLENVRRLRGERRLFVLERSGQLVACCGFSGVYDDIVRIGYVWTPPAFRNSGYARGVVGGALLTARQEGYRRACLLANDPAALQAYLALGFEAKDREVLAFFADDQQRLSA